METVERKVEALERMQILKLHTNSINEFKEQGKLNLSEHGALYWLDEKQKEAVRRAEQKYNILVYHVIHNFTSFGELLTMLYVSSDNEEWEADKKDLRKGYACAYVENLTDDYCSEFGGVYIAPLLGGVIRTA